MLTSGSAARKRLLVTIQCIYTGSEVGPVGSIPGGKHGNFKPDERTRIFVTIREFLSKNGIKWNGGA